MSEYCFEAGLMENGEDGIESLSAGCLGLALYYRAHATA